MINPHFLSRTCPPDQPLMRLPRLSDAECSKNHAYEKESCLRRAHRLIQVAVAQEVEHRAYARSAMALGSGVLTAGKRSRFYFEDFL
jgi:hypothetical protein